MQKRTKYQHKKNEDLRNYHGKYYTPTMIDWEKTGRIAVWYSYVHSPSVITVYNRMSIKHCTIWPAGADGEEVTKTARIMSQLSKNIDFTNSEAQNACIQWYT